LTADEPRGDRPLFPQPDMPYNRAMSAPAAAHRIARVLTLEQTLAMPG